MEITRTSVIVVVIVVAAVVVGAVIVGRVVVTIVMMMMMGSVVDRGTQRQRWRRGRRRVLYQVTAVGQDVVHRVRARPLQSVVRRCLMSAGSINRRR